MTARKWRSPPTTTWRCASRCALSAARATSRSRSSLPHTGRISPKCAYPHSIFVNHLFLGSRSIYFASIYFLEYNIYFDTSSVRAPAPMVPRSSCTFALARHSAGVARSTPALWGRCRRRRRARAPPPSAKGIPNAYKLLDVLTFAHVLFNES